MVKKEIKNIKYNIYIYILYCSQNIKNYFFLIIMILFITLSIEIN